MQSWKDTLIAAYDEMGDALFQREVMPEEPTSGLEEIVDWSDLEYLLDAELVRSKKEFKDHVRDAFAVAGKFFHEDRSWREVLAGMFPEYQRMYQTLPNRARKGA